MSLGMESMTSHESKTRTFKLKGRLYTLTVMQLMSGDRALFAQQLAETIAQAPRLFEANFRVFTRAELISRGITRQQ
jgi:septum site-determining protein MinC